MFHLAARKVKLICTLTGLMITVFSSCRKNAPIDSSKDISPRTGTDAELTLDSIYLYARQVYLWNDALPVYTTFNPRTKYAGIINSLSAFKTELYDISQLKVNPATGKPYELGEYTGQPKYSYLQVNTINNKRLSTKEPMNATPKADVAAVFDLGIAKVGYVYLQSFPKLDDCKSNLEVIFKQVAAQNPSHLIVDLRNNGGGYVETAEYLANLIVPADLNGKIMYTEQYNSLMQLGKTPILYNQPILNSLDRPLIVNGKIITKGHIDYSLDKNTYRFSKKGSLQTIKYVYFIVSGKTASASEMLINVIKPYLNVKIVGSKTYGKPVGFISISIKDITMYLSGFLIKNAVGSSDYFQGFPVDINVQEDGIHDIGDPDELCLKRVLTDIQAEFDRSKIKVIGMPTLSTSVVKDVAFEQHSILIENRYKL
ncbi:S41 family peptidase [Pedobacter frigoris]|uniref:S41 family peptidase n=1 Tax=Pedobacter frigoris TaxID=2571272 RepID=UPI00292CFD9F|nr:S41 family peptidase [Pedobacter frigoris]